MKCFVGAGDNEFKGLYYYPVQSSCRDCQQGYSAYAESALEGFWSHVDAVQGRSEIKQDVIDVIDVLTKACRGTWSVDKRFENVCSKPSGPKLFQQSIMEGVGRK